ncbi:immunity 49 family protein, partial [Streptomyces himastatinicus]
MVSIVSRHPFPTGNAAAGLAVLQENSSELIEGLEADSSDLGDALSTTLTLAEGHFLLDPIGQDLPTWLSWVSAMQLGSAVFAAATTTEPTVTCRIADKDRTLQATGVQPYTHAGTWLTAFYLAAVCRERDRMTALCRVPVSLLRESGAQFDEFQYQWIETLQEYWVGTGDIVPTLTAAIHGTDPEASTIADPETVAKQLYPPMEMFHRFITR